MLKNCDGSAVWQGAASPPEMRQLAALQRSCGRISTARACTAMTTAHAAPHSRQHHILLRSIHHQPVAQLASAAARRQGPQQRNVTAVCALGTNNGSTATQQRRQQSSEQGKQQTSAFQPSYDIKMLYDGADVVMIMHALVMASRCVA